MPKTDDELLNEALNTEPPSRSHSTVNGMPMQKEMPSPSSQQSTEFRQWQIGANDTFKPAGLTREKLPPAVYVFEEDPYGIYVKTIKVITDELLPLPDTANERVLEGMRVFWQRQDKYKKHGLLYKRGVLLWGPPGSGKTATLQLLSQHLMKMDGIVILCTIPPLTSNGLAALRRIEPERRIICIYEDIDEIIAQYGEHSILALLDGENQVENIVNIATTNYPERLGARIVNRPSRFDERIFVGMPSDHARKVYLEKVCIGRTEDQISKWVEDTNGLSIAHLRELAASVLCLDQDYDSVLSRLKSMKHKIRDNDGSGVTGFISK